MHQFRNIKIRVNQNGVYFLDYKDEKGKRIRQSTGIKAEPGNKKKVMLEATKVQMNLYKKLQEMPADIADELTLTEALIKFTAEIRNPHEYERDCEKFIAHVGDKYIKDVTNADLISFYKSLTTYEIKNGNGEVVKEKEYSLVSKADMNNHIKIWFDWLAKHNYIIKHNLERVPIPYVEKDTAIFDNDYEKILAELNSKEQKTLVQFLYNTGIRIGKALTILWDDVNWSTKTIKLLSKDRKRIVYFPITEKLEAIIKDIPRNHERFDSYGRQYMFMYKSPDSCKFFQKACKRANLKFGLHDLRRGFATKLHEMDVADRVIQDLMQHQDLNTTKKSYISKKTENSRKALEKSGL